jgi:uncharacterized coiled-coil DUF342 family protein
MPEDRMMELSLKMEQLMQQVESLRKQQEKLTENVQELVQTFQALAMHMGLATETYKPGAARSAPPPGFA